MARRIDKEMNDRLSEIVSTHLEELVSAVAQEVKRNVALELRSYLAGGRPTPGNGRRTARMAGPKRIVPCIAPGCNNPSKGPRFHYLCEKHMDAPKKDYEAWRKAKHEQKSA